MRARWVALFAIVTVAGAGLTACRDDADDAAAPTGEPGSCEFNAPDEEFPSVDAPGVTDTEIRVGALVAEENILGQPFEKTVEGAEAYFCKINEEGGVWGRELKMVSVRDDRGDPTTSINQARALVEEDEVFAVLPVATYVFVTGVNDYLGDSGVPTFGFNLTGWEGPPNLFGERGSYLCPTCPVIAPAYVADEIDAEKVAVLAYSVGESSDCAEGVRTGFEHYGHEVAHFDAALPFGVQPQDLTNNVNAIRDEGVDLVVTCVDINGTITIAQALDQAGVTDVSVYAPNGYDPRVLDAWGTLLDDFYFGLPFWPFEAADENEAMAEFIAFMEALDQVVSEFEFVGWSSAQLLVEGLELAGEDFTREKVVDAINELDDWDAHGTRDRIDWTIAHDRLGPDTCTAFVKVEGGEFVPVFGQPGQPFVCFPYGPTVDDLPPDLSEPAYKP